MPHEALVGRWLEWWNTGDEAIADEIYAPDYLRHGHDTPGRGPRPIKVLVAMFRSAFPDLKFEIHDAIAEDDRVAVRWTASGTNRGDFLGMPPTGRAGSLPGCDILRIDGGRIAESWPFYDRLALLDQLKPVAPDQV